jgi:hypothetical protein
MRRSVFSRARSLAVAACNTVEGRAKTSRAGQRRRETAGSQDGNKPSGFVTARNPAELLGGVFCSVGDGAVGRPAASVAGTVERRRAALVAGVQRPKHPDRLFVPGQPIDQHVAGDVVALLFGLLQRVAQRAGDGLVVGHQHLDHLAGALGHVVILDRRQRAVVRVAGGGLAAERANTLRCLVNGFEEVVVVLLGQLVDRVKGRSGHVPVHALRLDHQLIAVGQHDAEHLGHLLRTDSERPVRTASSGAETSSVS